MVLGLMRHRPMFFTVALRRRACMDGVAVQRRILTTVADGTEMCGTMPTDTRTMVRRW